MNKGGCSRGPCFLFSTTITARSSMQDRVDRVDMREINSWCSWEEWRLTTAQIMARVITTITVSEINGFTNKLRMPSGDFKEDKLTTSAQSTPCGTPAVTPSVTPSVTPCVTPHASPVVNRRSWFTSSPGPFLTTPELGCPNPGAEMGGNEGGGGAERWSFFGTRSTVQKSPTDPGSDSSPAFTLQSYLGLQKSSTLEGIKSQASLKVDDPANFMPPKLEIPGMEAKRPLPRPHKLKPRDMNVLTPSGF